MKGGKPRTSGTTSLAGQAFAQFRAGLYRYLLHRLHSAQDVEDLAQEVYLRLLRVAENRNVQYPQAYVYRVACNVLYEFRLHKHRDIVSFDSETAAEVANHLADDAVLPEEAYEQSGRESRLANVVAQLPPMQQAVLLMAKHHGLSHAEIASKLGISIHTARVHLYRALCYCRQKIAEE